VRAQHVTVDAVSVARPWCRLHVCVDGRVVVPRADRVLGSRIEIIVHFWRSSSCASSAWLNSVRFDVRDVRSRGREGSDLDIGRVDVYEDEHSLEQILEAMLTVALEPIWRGVGRRRRNDAADVTTTCAGSVANFSRNDEASNCGISERLGDAVLPEVASWVAKFASRDVSHRLSSAALETLAIIAYRQPISRARYRASRRER